MLPVRLSSRGSPAWSAAMHWINGMGEKLVQQLVDRSMVQTVADMYDLTPDQLGKLQRMGKKLAQKLVDAIAQSKTKPWSRCCMDWAFVMLVV